jgi:putative ABC transport system permease protein
MMVVATALLGMVTMVLATLNERRREMAILRAVGARPVHVLGLLVTEAGLLALAGAALGIALLYATLAVLRPFIDARFGLYVEIALPSMDELAALMAVAAAGVLAGLLPAWRAYRLSLADGMTVRT